MLNAFMPPAASSVGHNAWRSDLSIGCGGFKQSRGGHKAEINDLRACIEPKTVSMQSGE